MAVRVAGRVSVMCERERRARPWVANVRLFAIDFAVVLGVIGIYFLLRGAAPTRIEASVETTNALIAFERATGTFWEPHVQDWSLQSGLLKEFANFVYAYMHFPVLAVVGAWTWTRGRERFTFVRNVMFISMAIGLVFYYAFPAAPPRLMALHGYDLGFTDTVFGGDTSVQYAQPSLILNEYAAIPSFHFGWIALASATIWVNTRSVTWRVLAVALTVVMTWAIVASANHLFIDMALGGLVVGVAWKSARLLEMRQRRPRIVLSPSPQALGALGE